VPIVRSDKVVALAAMANKPCVYTQGDIKQTTVKRLAALMGGHMDGLTATRAIRSSTGAGARSDIPIIALTSYAMADDRRKFLAAGMDAYLAKPVRASDLEKALTESFRRKSGRRHGNSSAGKN
jgi:CheY-like chemotaxis protein